MNDIKSLQSTVIMIFPTDDINISSIKRKESKEYFSSKYNFELNKFSDNFPIPQNNVILLNGEFKSLNKIYIINEVIVEERRIIIRCLGPSEIVDEFFLQFRDDLRNIDLRDTKGEYAPILTTYESISVCRLDIDLKNIYNDKFTNFLENIDEDVQKFNSRLLITPFTLRIRIEYLDLPEKIQKEKITLTEKFITIELREKTDPDDQIYFVSTPTRTETHFKLIEKLEEYLK